MLSQETVKKNKVSLFFCKTKKTSFYGSLNLCTTQKQMHFQAMLLFELALI